MLNAVDAIIPILQVMKLKLRDVLKHAQDYTAIRGRARTEIHWWIRPQPHVFNQKTVLFLTL